MTGTKQLNKKLMTRGTLGGTLDALSIYWNGVTVRQWDAWIESISISPIEQTWSYGQAFGGTTAYTPVHGVIYKKKSPVAIVQVVEWRVGNLVRIAKIVRGPLFFDGISDQDKQRVFTLIRRRYSFRKLDFLLWTPEFFVEGVHHEFFRNLGLRKVVTGYSSILIDLQQDEADLLSEMNVKWRNQLRKAEKSGIRIRVGHGGAALDWLLARHENHRKRKRLRIPASQFVSAISISMRNKQGTLALVAYDGSEPIAGVLVFRHGTTSTYYVAWNGPSGRKIFANNLLIWHAIKELRSRGVRWLDLGGVDGLSMPGVARFKIGVGGKLYTLAGTYL
ncbi:MAG: hypothetical protein CMM58_01835 [Rhodospirillaceae bacterium]|nr:hypothetical protein [Rhodospirillaceae bacterium]|tara:strand:+ start:1802 stop:2803 length:1002 start_codon:yes stop_codon:yes gene_type:complete